MKKLISISAGIFVSAICFQSGQAQQIEELALSITPATNAQVTSGQSLALHIETPGIAWPTHLSVGGDSIPLIERQGTSPFDLEIPIPVDRQGQVTLAISATAYDASTSRIKSAFVPYTLTAVPSPSEVPASHRIYGQQIVLYPQGTANRRSMANLHFTAVFTNGVQRDVTSSSFGTTYLSSNPSVVTVSPDGAVSALAPGVAYVLADFKGQQEFFEIYVRDPSTGFAPVAEYTSGISVSKSGFRRDPTTGIYSQQVSITNNTVWPIPRPIHLVVSNLPQGIRMAENRDKTRVVQPLGSPIVDVNLPADAEFLKPGETSTIMLKFENVQNLSITYTLRVFGAAFP